MEELEILFHGQCQLIDFGESRTAGKFLKIRLSDHDGDPLDPFRGMDTATAKKAGHILNITISRGDILQAAEIGKAEAPGGTELARRLDANKVWGNPKVFDALIPNDEARKTYRRWIATEGCVVCGKTGEDIHPHHWRELEEGAGAGLKPPDYMCIGLCYDHHTGNNGVHTIGVKTWMKNIWDKGINSGFHPKYVAVSVKMAKFNRMAFKEMYSINSLKEVTEDMLENFSEIYGIRLLNIGTVEGSE